MLSELIQFANHHLLLEVTGKRVTRDFGFGLEIQVNYFFMEMQELLHGTCTTTEMYCTDCLQEIFFNKGFLKILAKFTAKYLCQSFFFNKIVGTARKFIKDRQRGRSFIGSC